VPATQRIGVQRVAQFAASDDQPGHEGQRGRRDGGREPGHVHQGEPAGEGHVLDLLAEVFQVGGFGEAHERGARVFSRAVGRGGRESAIRVSISIGVTPSSGVVRLGVPAGRAGRATCVRRPAGR
jgi:hypothetical protein